MNEFTKTKFHSLSEKRQHKELAKLLNGLYVLVQNQQPFESSLYETYAGWAEKKTTIDWSCFKSIADAYHFHLKLAGLSSNENHCLINHFDKNTSEALWPIHLYLDNLRSAHNVGSILRTVESFGLKKVWFSKGTPWIDANQVRKTSCNAYFYVDCCRIDMRDELPKPVIALETACDAISVYDFAFPESFTLAVGNEEYGCSKETLKIAEAIIKIPMRGRKNSLNVANAFAIVASEILRQRTYL